MNVVMQSCLEVKILKLKKLKMPTSLHHIIYISISINKLNLQLSFMNVQMVPDHK